jgi:23S rRNA pseudouridine1911/1915/1917 synthase
MARLQVTEPGTLLPFLIASLDGWARKTVKLRLKTGCVQVNGVSVTRHDHALMPGDLVEVGASTQPIARDPSALEILYLDADLIVINKPAGLLSVGEATGNKEHALGLLRTQLSRPKHPLRLWPAHRLDRDTSGVLLFTTSLEMRKAVSQLWGEAEKIYLAVVEGHPDPDQGTIDQPLWQDPVEYRMHVGPHPTAKEAITHFTTKQNAKKRSLLEIRIETGRQHQIRAHLAWLGHPIIGDPRYGRAGPRLGLHARRLTITHPETKKRLSFEIDAPDDFYGLVR